MENTIIGFGFIFLGALCGGSFGLPSKFAKADTPWEVLWGPFFLIATILIPVVVAPLAVSNLCEVYCQVEPRTIVMVLLFGLLWGLGSMTLGKSFAFIGLSLAYALNYGAQIACGFLLPILLFNREQLLTQHGYMFLGGVAVCLVGVVISGRAGILKEQSLASSTGERETSSAEKPKALIGLIIGVISGVLCACYAVALTYAGPIGKVAGQSNPPWAAAWAVTALILWGGAVSSCLYCVVQLTKNKTWGHFTKPGAGLVLLLAAAMAVLHDAAIFFFGLAWITLGDSMAVGYGYPVFMAFAIIVGNVHGFRCGEWRGASRQSITWIIVGIAVLIVGVCVIATGKSLM
jgi:L-rhamnose-H+ transport protein